MARTVLHRALGIPGALFLGLGSMLGTGVFVTIGLGACLFLAFQVPLPVWGGGLALIALGLLGHGLSTFIRRSR